MSHTPSGKFDQNAPMTAQAPAADNRLVQPLASRVDSLPRVWQEALSEPSVKASLERVCAYVDQRVAQGVTVYPADPFKALRTLDPDRVRVVILGQDPYHGPGQAQGLAFSVPDASKRPPSLRNIVKELAAEFPNRAAMPRNDLQPWADQGVFLLNTSLTVEAASAGAHAKRGWEAVTDALIARVAQSKTPKVFMLWGAHAQAKAGLLPPDASHLVLRANHPSPLSATRPPVPFIGCGHFKTANEWLQNNGVLPVDWCGPLENPCINLELAL